MKKQKTIKLKILLDDEKITIDQVLQKLNEIYKNDKFTTTSGDYLFQIKQFYRGKNDE